MGTPLRFRAMILWMKSARSINMEIKRVYLSYIDGLYDPMESKIGDRLLEKITFFLTDDVGYDGIDVFKNHLLNAEYIYFGCNMHRLEKKGDTILISDDYIADDDERLFYSTEIKLDELARVLDQWKEICKIVPPYVVITRDGEKITLQGYESLDDMNKVH